MQVGATVEQDTAYPGWAPNPGSAVVKLAQEVLTEVTGHEAKVCPFILFDKLLLIACSVSRQRFVSVTAPHVETECM